VILRLERETSSSITENGKTRLTTALTVLVSQGDNAEIYRDYYLPDLPLGYKRMMHSFMLSLDKKRFDATVVDDEQEAKPQ